MRLNGLRFRPGDCPSSLELGKAWRPANIEACIEAFGPEPEACSKATSRTKGAPGRKWPCCEHVQAAEQTELLRGPRRAGDVGSHGRDFYRLKNCLTTTSRAEQYWTTGEEDRWAEAKTGRGRVSRSITRSVFGQGVGGHGAAGS